MEPTYLLNRNGEVVWGIKLAVVDNDRIKIKEVVAKLRLRLRKIYFRGQMLKKEIL